MNFFIIKNLFVLCMISFSSLFTYFIISGLGIIVSGSTLQRTFIKVEKQLIAELQGSS